MLDERTPEEIKQDILLTLELLDIREGSYTNDMVSPIALELWKVHQSLKALVPMVYVDETSGEYIDKKAADYGIVRKPGVKASAIMRFTGDNGTIVPKGTVFLTADGLEFETTTSVTIINGVAEVEIKAIDVGDIYNVPAGTINQQLVSITGLNNFENEAAAEGSNEESDKNFVDRLYKYIRKPATSGNDDNYIQWALEVPGVGDAKVYPLWNGNGTVKVLIVGDDKGPVDTFIVNRCYEHIEEHRPVGANVTVISADSLDINVSATIDIDSSTTKSEIEEIFKDALNKYLQDISFYEYEIVYNRIAYMLLDIKGVRDYSVLTVNGGTSNVAIGADEVPVVGTVVVI